MKRRNSSFRPFACSEASTGGRSVSGQVMRRVPASNVSRVESCRATRSLLAQRAPRPAGVALRRGRSGARPVPQRRLKHRAARRHWGRHAGAYPSRALRRPRPRRAGSACLTSLEHLIAEGVHAANGRHFCVGICYPQRLGQIKLSKARGSRNAGRDFSVKLAGRPKGQRSS